MTGEKCVFYDYRSHQPRAGTPQKTPPWVLVPPPSYHASRTLSANARSTAVLHTGILLPTSILRKVLVRWLLAERRRRRARHCEGGVAV